jgi:diguanylate cyclase (GGDEF)-like protein
MKSITIKEVMLRITVTILATELLIMVGIDLVAFNFTSLQAAFIDALVLTLISSPIIYFWIIKPFVDTKNETLAELDNLANLDPLTKLANRRLLYSHFKKLKLNNKSFRPYSALLLIDLDGFKKVNDNHGHLMGDSVLIQIGERLKSITREDDLVSRVGGDEIVVLINYLDSNEQVSRAKAFQISEKILTIIKQPIKCDICTIEVAASIGIRIIGLEELDINTVMSEVDSAMYKAKNTGKDCAVFFKN